jgi:hypothetical protein
MDGDRFEGAIKRLSHDGLRRRDAVKALAAAVLGITFGGVATGVSDAEPRKGKHKKRCVKPTSACPPDPTTCCSKQCCLGVGQPEDGAQVCSSKKAVCCTPDQGGGFCDKGFTQCCPPTTQDPNGSCTPSGYTCCTSEQGGGACPSEEPICCPPDPEHQFGSCCAGEGCCNTSKSKARSRPTARTARERGRPRQ